MSTLSILKKVQKTAYHGSKMASGLKGKIKNFQLWQILYAVLEYYTFKSNLPPLICHHQVKSPFSNGLAQWHCEGILKSSVCFCDTRRIFKG